MKPLGQTIFKWHPIRGLTFGPQYVYDSYGIINKFIGTVQGGIGDDHTNPKSKSATTRTGTGHSTPKGPRCTREFKGMSPGAAKGGAGHSARPVAYTQCQRRISPNGTRWPKPANGSLPASCASSRRFSFMASRPSCPHDVWMALGPSAWRPVGHGLPLQFVRFSGRALTEGGGGPQDRRRPSPGDQPRAKTVTDCFQYRNKVGLDVALEALRDAWRQKKVTMDDLWRYATVCRVAKVMRPYMESVV